MFGVCPPASETNGMAALNRYIIQRNTILYYEAPVDWKSFFNAATQITPVLHAALKTVCCPEQTVMKIS